MDTTQNLDRRGFLLVQLHTSNVSMTPIRRLSTFTAFNQFPFSYLYPFKSKASSITHGNLNFERMHLNFGAFLTPLLCSCGRRTRYLSPCIHGIGKSVVMQSLSLDVIVHGFSVGNLELTVSRRDLCYDESLHRLFLRSTPAPCVDRMLKM